MTELEEVSRTYEGINGQIELLYSRVEITRKGALAFGTHGMDGTKIIFLKNLTALQFKEAGKVTSGYIQFVFPGSQEDKGGLFSAAKDENTVMFTAAQQSQFEDLRDRIVARLDF